MSSMTVQELAKSLGKDKDDLISDIEYQIQTGVESLGVNKCFSVIEIKRYGNYEYNPPSQGNCIKISDL